MKETKEIKVLSGRVGQYGYHIEYTKKVRFNQLLILKARVYHEFPAIYNVEKWDIDELIETIKVFYIDGTIREASIGSTYELKSAVKFLNRGIKDVV